MRKYLVGLIVAVIVTSVSVASASVSGPSKPVAVPKGKPIVIGMPIAVTGFVNFFDGPSLIGAGVAVKEINASGGLLGRPVKIVVADHKSDVSLVTSAALDVIQKGANFLVPTVDYDFGSPSARAAEKHNPPIITISGAGDARLGVKGVGPYTYNTFAGAPSEGGTAANFAYTVKGWRKAYVLEDPTINYAKELTKYFEYTYPKLGGQIVGKDTFQNSDPSIATQINRMRSAGADVIMLGSYPPGGASAIKQIRAAGIKTPIVTGVAFDGNFWLPAIPGLKDVFIVSSGLTAPGVDPDPVRRAFFRAYAKENGGKPAPLASQALVGYASVQAIARAVKRAGTIESKAVKAQLDKFRNEPLGVGPTTWTPKCHIPLTRGFIVVEAANDDVKYAGQPKLEKLSSSIC